MGSPMSLKMVYTYLGNSSTTEVPNISPAEWDVIRHRVPEFARKPKLTVVLTTTHVNIKAEKPTSNLKKRVVQTKRKPGLQKSRSRPSLLKKSKWGKVRDVEKGKLVPK